MGKISAVKHVGAGNENGPVVGVRQKCWHPEGDYDLPESHVGFFNNNTHPLVCFFGGFGTAKTHTGAQKAVLKLLTNHNKIGGAVAPTMSHVDRVMIPTVQMVLDECWEFVYANGKTGPVQYKIVRSQTNPRIEVPLFGSSMEFTYASPDNLKGQNWRWAWGDEPGLWDEKVWRMFIARIRVKNRPGEYERTGGFRQIMLTGTPEGYNWLYYQTVGNEKNAGCEIGESPRCRVWYASTRDAPWLDPGVLEMLLEEYPADLAAEKIDGKFLPVGKGQVYTFERKKHVVACEFDPDYPITFTMDWGVAPIVAVVQQTRPMPPVKGQKGKPKTVTYALDEVQFARGSIDDVVKELANRWGSRLKNITTGEQRFAVQCCGDATGKAQTATGTAAWEDFYKRLAAHEIAFEERQLNSNPPVSDRVAVMNAQLDHGYYFVHPRCKNLIRSFESTYWDEAKSGRKLEKKAGSDFTHMSDAATYDIFRLHGLDRVKMSEAGRTGYKGGMSLDDWIDDTSRDQRKPSGRKAAKSRGF